MTVEKIKVLIEREILKALKETNNHKDKSAQLLGISRMTLWNYLKRMKRHDLIYPPKRGVPHSGRKRKA